MHTGVAQASSTLEVVGNVYGTGGPNQITTINFTVALAPGGTAVDIQKMVLVYSNATTIETLERKDDSDIINGQWCVSKIRNDLGGNNWLLEAGEQFDIGAMPKYGIYKNDKFQLEVKPIIGTPLAIKRSVPAAVEQINLLY